MKKTQPIEEETLLPSSLLDDEYLGPEIIRNNESYTNYKLKEMGQNCEHDMIKSNFSNQNNSNSDLKEDISEDTNDLSKEKDEQSLKINYLNQSNSTNDFLKIEKIFQKK